MKSKSKVVIVGGGVVGVSALYHLAKKGWTDVVLVERKELTSGSTWHAAGLLPLFNMSYSVGQLHKYAVNLYKKLEEETGNGRCKDLIIRGGMNISPEEMDNLLSSHPKILEVAVTEYAYDILGEKVGVVAVVAEGETILLDEIIDFLKDKQIAKYKMPEDLRVIDVLPKNPVGKVLRRELRDLFT